MGKADTWETMPRYQCCIPYAGVTQLAESQPSKLSVVGSNPTIRSIFVHAS